MSTEPLDPNAALIVIDVQEGFRDDAFWGPRNNPAANDNIRALVAAWRQTGRPLVLVQHDSATPGSPLAPGQPGHAFQSGIDGPHDLLVRKSVNSSFHGTPDLSAWLRAADIRTIVICGITTNHCCETTARLGGNLGFDVRFALDATHTFDRTGPDGRRVPAAELARVTGVNLHGEFATVQTTAQLLAALGAP